MSRVVASRSACGPTNRSGRALREGTALLTQAGRTVGVAAAVRRVEGPDAAWKRLAHARADNLALVKDVDFGHMWLGGAAAAAAIPGGVL